MQRLAAIAVATSLIVWWPAFTLGVYHAIFFAQIFALWAVATTAFFVGVLLLGRRGAARRVLTSDPVGLDSVDVADPRQYHQP
ncbi:hypothetical protein FXW78_34205 [Rhodococcus opacus]|nr:hypothetical protein [Rhodococcus opacus]